MWADDEDAYADECECSHQHDLSQEWQETDAASFWTVWADDSDNDDGGGDDDDFDDDVCCVPPFIFHVV